MELTKEHYLHVQNSILIDRKLDATMKIIFAEIISLSKSLKGCYAGNEYFGKIVGINPEGASRQISKLVRLGYIETKKSYKNYRMVRKISVLKQLKEDSPNSIYVNIPYSVLFDVNLSSTQKLLISEIIALTKLPDGCIKSNREFGELFGIGTSAIFKQIKKLNVLNYIVINNALKNRKIELTNSYITNSFVPESQNGYSQIINSSVPESQNGYSSENTINTIKNSLDIVPVLLQFTSTEKSLDINELEEKIINSCGRGEKLLTQAKRNDIDNYWLYGSNNQEIESLQQLVKEYQNALNNI
jgi:DNA-binding Lrp family transcriptional regulator